MQTRNTRGFISTRAILALLVLMSVMPLSSLMILNIAKLKFNHDDISDEIALLQLRRIMLISYDLQNYGDHLQFLYHGKEYSLDLINNRLVLSPGYQMFLNDVDDLSFKERDNVILIEYFKKGVAYETSLTNKNGIYLDEFYDYDGDSDSL